MTTANSNLESKTQTMVRGHEFVMERTFAAPRELIFKVFSDPKHLTHWWGPTGWSLPVCKVDFRVGGLWIYCMKGPDGMEGWGRATYQEIVAPERIVYADAFADDQGNALEGMPQMVITVDFMDVGGKTQLRSTALFATETELEQTVGMGMEEGMKQTWDRLEQYLASA